MKRTFQSMSIRNKMALLYSLLFVILMLGQLLASGSMVSQTVQTQANDYILQTLEQTLSKMEVYIDSLRMMTSTIAANEAIVGVLQDNAKGQSSETLSNFSYRDSQILQEEISKLTVAWDGINSVQLVTPQRMFHYNFGSASGFDMGELSENEGERLKASQGELLLFSTRRAPVDKYYAKDAQVFSVARKIYRFINHQELGYVFVNIHESKVRDIIEAVRFGATGVLHLYDAQGAVISSPDQERVGARLPGALLKEERYGNRVGYSVVNNTLIAQCYSQALQWGIMTEIPIQEVTAPLLSLQNTNLMLGIIGIAIAIGVSTLFAGAMVKPLRSLVTSMRQIRANRLGARVAVVSSDELGELSSEFNAMSDDLQNIIRLNCEIELHRKEAHLRAIQAQINPHFLYNTLDTIYWMLVLQGEEKTSDLVIALSEMMRYSISGSSERLVTLRREISMLKHYQTIQDARYEGKLDWVYQIPQELWGYYICKMTLQPIVENAILHGMNTERPMRIAVAAMRQGEELILSISDNGKGIDQETLAGILDEKDNRESVHHTGFGLPGVHRQIQIRFGEAYGLTVSSGIGEGTTVRMRLPLSLEDGKEESHEDLVGG